MSIENIDMGWKYNLGLAISGIVGAKTPFRIQYKKHLFEKKLELYKIKENIENDFHNEYVRELSKCKDMKNSIDSKLPIATREFIEDYINRVEKMPEYKKILDEEKEKILKTVFKDIEIIEAQENEIDFRMGVIEDFKNNKSTHNKFY